MQEQNRTAASSRGTHPRESGASQNTTGASSSHPGPDEEQPSGAAVPESAGERIAHAPLFAERERERERERGEGEGERETPTLCVLLYWQRNLLMVVRYIYDSSGSSMGVRARILTPCLGVPPSKPHLAGLMFTLILRNNVVRLSGRLVLHDGLLLFGRTENPIHPFLPATWWSCLRR
jgi:hypothetical protein